MPDLAGARFAEGDHISASCELCGVRTTVALAGTYHQDVVDQALSECAEWLEAHVEAFHPEHADALGERRGPAASEGDARA